MTDAERAEQLAGEAWREQLFAERALPGRYDITPAQVMPIIVQSAAGLRLEDMRWGWHREVAVKVKPSEAHPDGRKRVNRLMINAKSETAAAIWPWRDAFRDRRCVVPATSYYEWERDAKERPLSKHAFRDKDGKLLLIAGLWSTETTKDGKPEPGFIVLTRPMVLYRRVHDRTPVMLTGDDARAWADPDAPPAEVAALLASRGDDDLVVREVEMGAEKRGDGPWVAETREPWPWQI